MLTGCVTAYAQKQAATASQNRSEVCAVQPSYPLPQSALVQAMLLSQVNTAMSQCLRQPEYWAWRGALQLQLEQPQQAAESLERALLLQPDLPGAQLDYAQALLTLGDLVAATDLLQQVQQHPDLSSTLRAQLQSILDTLIVTTYNLGTNRWRISSALSYDNNLNNAPAATQLTLTFPQGNATLALAQGYQRQSGSAWLGLLQWQRLQPQGQQGLWLLQAQLQHRASRARTDYSLSQLSATWLQAPAAPAQWLGQLAWQNLYFGGQQWLQGWDLSAQRQWRLTQQEHCRISAGIDIQKRNYPSSPELNGHYAGVLAGLYCAPDARHGYGLQLRAGEDRANHAGRPGGHYQRHTLQLSGRWPWGRQQLDASYDWGLQTDSQGYSPLFDNNRHRRTQRHSLQLTLARNLGQHPGGAQLFVQLQLAQQRSNLPAFGQKQASLAAGMRWGFD